MSSPIWAGRIDGTFPEERRERACKIIDKYSSCDDDYQVTTEAFRTKARSWMDKDEESYFAATVCSYETLPCKDSNRCGFDSRKARRVEFYASTRMILTLNSLEKQMSLKRRPYDV